MNNSIAIYGSRRQEPYIGEFAGLFAFLEESGFKVTVHPKIATYLRDKGVDLRGAAISGTIPEETVLVMSIGGDGTFLRASRWVGMREIPILGVNTGHLGFLSSCRLEEVRDVLRAICRGEVTVERRMILEVMSDYLPGDAWPYALNEVAILKEETASMISIRTNINGNFLADYRADGLIVATPTGSTAYNLSAGGPILEPTLDCITLSPVAPHTLTVRPLVVGGGSDLSFKAESRTQEFKISIDGRCHTLPAGTEVRVRRAEFSTMLVRMKDSNFATVLRDKLLWNASAAKM